MAPRVDPSARRRFHEAPGHPAHACAGVSGRRLRLLGARRTGVTLGVLVLLVLLGASLGPWREAISDFSGRRSPFWVMEDFRAFYAAARLVSTGHGSQLYQPAVIGAVERGGQGRLSAGFHTLAYFNPPFFAWLIGPLARLSLSRAFQVWTGLSVGLLLVDSWLLWRVAARLDLRLRLLLLLGFWSLYPVSYGLRLGQFSLLLVAAWCSAYLLLQRGRDRAAGLALTIFLVKPEMLVPVALALGWKRRWRVFETLIPLTLLAVGASIAVVGWHEALRYPAYLLQSTAWKDNGIAIQLMYGWNGLLASSWSPLPIPSQTIVALLLSAVGLTVALWTWRGTLQPASPSFAGQWLLLTLATLLADPHLYLQDTLVIVPAAVAYLASSSGVRRDLTWLALATGAVVLRAGIYPNQHLHFNPFACLMALALLSWPVSRVWRWVRPLPAVPPVALPAATTEELSFADGD